MNRYVYTGSASMIAPTRIINPGDILTPEDFPPTTGKRREFSRERGVEYVSYGITSEEQIAALVERGLLRDYNEYRKDQHLAAWLDARAKVTELENALANAKAELSALESDGP